MSIRRESAPVGAARFIQDAGDFVANARQSFELALARRQVRQRTFNELASLSDRDLADIGFARCDLSRIAYEHALQTVPATVR